MKFSGRLIQAPPRSSPAGTALIAITAVVLSIAPFSPLFRVWAALCSALLCIIALYARQVHALHLAVLAFLMSSLPLLGPTLSRWPFILLIPAVLYLAVALAVPRLRSSLLWARLGRCSSDIIVLVVLTAVVSGIALTVWYRWFRPDVSIHTGSIPEMPVWLFPVAGLAFSLGNAAVEEIVYRGVVMQATDSAFGSGSVSLFIQGWLFGAMHYLRGFPNGFWGVAMAAVYGVMLGAIRRRSRGMFAPWLAHVFADIVIFMILMFIVLQ